jgi:RNA methyltransferase, TrmH family
MATDDVIRSKTNPLVRRLRELVRGDRASGVLLIEGVRLTEEALDAGVTVVEAAVAPTLEKQDRGRELIERLTKKNVPMRRLHPDVLASLSDVETSQGVLVIARLPEGDPKKIGGKNALALVIAGVQNPGNVGSLLRTAEAAGATGAFVGDGTADPLSPKALRGAMGSAFRVPLAEASTMSAVESLRRAGVTVWASTGKGQRYDAIDWRRPSAVVVGNEGTGVPDEIVHACSGRVTVPMAGNVESLNVAVAAGVILFEAARQRRK